MSRFVNPGVQYFTNAGSPLAGGVLSFFESGTNNPLVVYSDSAETIVAGSEITLDAAGRVPNLFWTGTARVVLRDSQGVQIYDRDPVGGDTQFNNLATWDNSRIYSQYDTVRGSNGKIYESLINDNQGNNPTDNPGDNPNWKEVQFIDVYNDDVVYPVNALVLDVDKLYVSLISNNLGNRPSTDAGTNWQDFGQASRLPYNNASSLLVAVNVQAAIDELKTTIDSLPSSVVYKGQLDVSAGDSALPASPSNGDLYYISVGGTITVSVNGAAPAPTAVNPGEIIIYNGTLGQWDLTAAVQNAASVTYDNTSSGLAATNVQNAIDELDTDQDALETLLAGLTRQEVEQLININSTTISTAQWGFVGAMDQGGATTDSVTFSGLSLTGNASVDGEIQQVRATGSDAVRRYTLGSGSTAVADDLSIDFTFVSGVAANYTWSNSNYSFAVARGAGSLPATESAALADSDLYCDSSGNSYANTMSIVVGSGSAALSAGDEGIRLGVVNLGVIHSARNDAGVAGHHIFINPNGTVGSIQTSGTATLYNTSSDPRMKDFYEFGPNFDDEVNNMFASLWSTFRLFRWKNDPDGEMVWGFDAHAVIDAGLDMGAEGEGPRDLNIGDVYKTENVKKSDGSIEKIEHKVSPAGVDQSKAVPILLAKIEQLERRLSALES